MAHDPIEHTPLIPLPEVGGNIKYPWEYMEVGDWFTVYTDEVPGPHPPESSEALYALQNRLASACNNRWRKYRERYRTKMDAEECCVRVYRTSISSR